MAARFWVGGTGTWDAADTAHWSATSGGAGGASVPVAADTVTLDASSGGGTVTVNHATLSVTSITMGAFTGTLDFAANNNNVTLSTSFSGTGSGLRTLNLGNGTWTLPATGTVWNMTTVTNLTFNANASVITITGTTASTKTFAGGGLTYATVSIAAAGTGESLGAVNFTGANTIGTFLVAANNYIVLQAGLTLTIVNAFTFTGSAGSYICLVSASGGNTATISVASGTPTIVYGMIRDITFTGGATFSATNSYDLGRNPGITITAPAAGGGGGGGASWIFRPTLRPRSR